jgi:hypothetical protein
VYIITRSLGFFIVSVIATKCNEPSRIEIKAAENARLMVFSKRPSIVYYNGEPQLVGRI